MLRTKPDHVLLNIMRMPNLWIEWEHDTLFHLMNPDACMTLQLLLHKKIDRLSSFYENQMTNAAKLNKEEKKE